MNHTDYSKMSTTPAIVEIDEEIDSLTTPAIIESDEAKIDTIVTPAIVESEPETATAIEGFVSGCRKLNVRNAPNSKANIVCTINKDSEVIVDVENSTDAFYKVCTEAGAEGYCMKDYITITQ